MDHGINKDHDNEKKIKIDEKYLERIEKENNCLHYFGDWIHKIDDLKEQFLSGKPFENVVIDDFLEDSYAEKLYELFPTNFKEWYRYENPIEVKYAFDNIDQLPGELKNYFYYLSCEQVRTKIAEITDISDLQYDEYLHGAGLHSHPRYGRLNIHLDYEKHPYSGKERRINIIYFLTKDWKTSWNGSNELWDPKVSQCIKKTDIQFNRAIIFKTNDISYHGLPDHIKCPENIFRKSLAYYYVSPLNSNKKEEDEYRKKAKFVKRPGDPYDKNMEELYEIRRYRRITKDDLQVLFPHWKKDY